MHKIKNWFSTIRVKNGAYSLGTVIVVICIVLVINMLIGQLPQSVRSFDISESKLYTIGDTTKELLGQLQEDITIITVAQADNVDPRITGLVQTYAEASPHISAKLIDPVAKPSALTTYNTTENSLVVQCNSTGKQTTVSFDDIILYDTMSYYYYGQYTETEFDGEGQLTSAIAYVTNDVSKKIYTTTGHGEADVPATVTDLIDKANMETASLNLLTIGNVPADCDLLLINAPTSDLAQDERDMILEYLKNGGNLTVLTGVSQKERPNLQAVLTNYGIEMLDGYIADTQRCYQNNYYSIFPKTSVSHQITAGFSDNDLALLNNAAGLAVSTDLRDGLTVESFMTTSDSGYQVTESGQTQGVYSLGVTATDNTSEKTTHVTAIGAESLISENITSSFSNVTNLDIFMNALAWNFEDMENISIEAKSLSVTYNTVANAGVWSALFIFIIPVATLVTGFYIWLKRRRA
ncbi:MAG: GldG family protein [Oscillospiraceae bacterium]|nr:GldG family protein [Oscillospiraceae bacterium]